MTDFEWWAAILLAAGIFVFIFWIVKTALDARELARWKEENLRMYTSDRKYEEYACAQCGNFTVWRSPGWSVCDCCGMKTEI